MELGFFFRIRYYDYVLEHGVWQKTSFVAGLLYRRYSDIHRTGCARETD